MDCLPPSLKGRTYYHPTGRGIEKRLGEQMEEIKKRKGREGGA